MVRLRGRVVALAAVVAVVTVLISGIAVLTLYRAGAPDVASKALGRDAETVATTVANVSGRGAGTRTQVGVETLRRTFAKRGIELTVISPAVEDDDVELSPSGALTPEDVDTMRKAAAAGESASFSRQVETDDGSTTVVEGRAVDGTAVILLQPLDDAMADSLIPRRRLLFSLLLGLVGGTAAGALLSLRFR